VEPVSIELNYHTSSSTLTFFNFILYTKFNGRKTNRTHNVPLGVGLNCYYNELQSKLCSLLHRNWLSRLQDALLSRSMLWIGCQDQRYYKPKIGISGSLYRVLKETFFLLRAMQYGIENYLGQYYCAISVDIEQSL